MSPNNNVLEGFIITPARRTGKVFTKPDEDEWGKKPDFEFRMVIRPRGRKALQEYPAGSAGWMDVWFLCLAG
jgi:hypothetical protein